MSIRTNIEMTVMGKNGIRTKQFQSKSWLLHFMELWYEMLGYNSNSLAGINDIGSVGRNLAANNQTYPNLALHAGGGGMVCWVHVEDYDLGWGGVGGPDAQNVGIVVGTGAGAVAPDDDALNTKIAHGSAATQLEYGGMEIFPPTFAGANGSMVLRRYFTNNSGGGITVNEVGIYSPAYNGATSAIYIFCIARDLTGGIAVADTELLRVTYTVQITV